MEDEGLDGSVRYEVWDLHVDWFCVGDGCNRYDDAFVIIIL